MKIQFVSDLHCEFYQDGGQRMLEELPVSGDVLVVAGDLADSVHLTPAVGWLCARFPEVIFVAGNHEHYSATRSVLLAQKEKLTFEFKNFHWLDANTVTVAGQRFTGATGWFPNAPDNWAYESLLKDFHMIPDFKQWVYQTHKLERKFLLNNVQPNDVVVTHHLPTNLSSPERFKGSRLSRFYIAQLHDVILQRRPKLWLHGHAHEPCDYMVVKCRVAANPRGYPHTSEPQNFRPNLCVEV